jgi:hypothetical protein
MQTYLLLTNESIELNVPVKGIELVNIADFLQDSSQKWRKTDVLGAIANSEKELETVSELLDENLIVTELYLVESKNEILDLSIKILSEKLQEVSALATRALQQEAELRADFMKLQENFHSAEEMLNTIPNMQTYDAVTLPLTQKNVVLRASKDRAGKYLSSVKQKLPVSSENMIAIEVNITSITYMNESDVIAFSITLEEENEIYYEWRIPLMYLKPESVLLTLDKPSTTYPQSVYLNISLSEGAESEVKLPLSTKRLLPSECLSGHNIVFNEPIALTVKKQINPYGYSVLRGGQGLVPVGEERPYSQLKEFLSEIDLRKYIELSQPYNENSQYVRWVPEHSAILLHPHPSSLSKLFIPLTEGLTPIAVRVSYKNLESVSPDIDLGIAFIRSEKTLSKVTESYINVWQKVQSKTQSVAKFDMEGEPLSAIVICTKASSGFSPDNSQLMLLGVEVEYQVSGGI